MCDIEPSIEVTEKVVNVSGPILFDVAVSMTGHGKFHNFLLLVNSISYMAVVCELNNVSYLLPAADCDFKMTSDDKGLLVSMAYIGFIVSSHFWGCMADISGRRKVLVVSLGLDIICTIASSFSPSYSILLVFRFFTGILIACPASVVFTYISEFHGVATRARAIMFISASIALGSIVLPCFAWLIIPQAWSFELPAFTFSSWRIFLVVCTIPSVLSFFLLIFCLPESPKYLVNIGKNEEAVKILERIYVINSGNEPYTYKVKSVVDDSSDIYGQYVDEKYVNKVWIIRVLRCVWNQTYPLFKISYLPKTFLVCFLQFGVCACFQTMLLWMPEIFQRISQHTDNNPDVLPTVCDAVNSIPHEQHNYTSGVEYVNYWINDLKNYRIFDDDSTKNLDLISAVDECSTDISPESFLYTLIVGGATAISGLVIGFIVSYVNQKTVNIILTISAGALGISLNYVTSTEGILTLICLFVSFTQHSSGLVNSITVDNFPTSIRAMAVCLSMMLGQIGSIFGSLFIGAVIDTSCVSIFFTLSGIAFSCGLLSLLLPGLFLKSCRHTCRGKNDIENSIHTSQTTL